MGAVGPAFYRVASSEIVSDVIDGEAVVVNLSSGDYYTLNATGAVVWELVRGGCSPAALHEAARERFAGDGEAVCAACEAFVGRLLAEGLIVAVEEGAPDPPARPTVAAVPFAPPALVKYTDMEDLLSLDPVHEVDELGWPQPQGQKQS